MGKHLELYGEEDWFSHKHQSALELYIAGKHTCATNTVQTAVQVCLELLGTCVDVVPVIMPVTAPPDTMAAVLRSGAHPLLLDIEEETLQIDPEQLRDAIDMLAEEERVPIVLLNRPFGQPVRPDILEAIADLPSICDSRLVPHPELEEDDLPCSFNIFDLTPICGSGAIIVHPFVTQVGQLKEVRSGSMGLSGALSEQQAKHAHAVLKSFPLQIKLYKETLNQLMAYGLEVMGPSKWPSPMWIKVSNARLVAAHLASYDIISVVGLYPLYDLEEVKRRYVEEPEYPVAEKLENSFVCIPTHQEVQGREEEIVNRIKEVL